MMADLADLVGDQPADLTWLIYNWLICMTEADLSLGDEHADLAC